MRPRFSELDKVKTLGKFAGYEGYIVASHWKDGGWIYKICLSEEGQIKDIFDNWIPEDFLEPMR